MFWWCRGHVGCAVVCFNHALVVLWSCFDRVVYSFCVSVILISCFDDVSNIFWWCGGHAVVLFQIHVAHFGHLVMFQIHAN